MDQINYDKSLKILIFIFLGILIMANLFPEPFWGVHHFVFLPVLSKAIFLLIVLYFTLIYPKSKEKRLHETLFKFLFTKRPNLIFILLSGIFAVVFYSFPIFLDTYGDAKYIFLDKTVTYTSLDQFPLDHLWKYDILDPKLGTKSVLSLISYFSFLSNSPVFEVFKVWGAVWGSFFVFIWLRLVNETIQEPNWKLIGYFLGLSAPFLLVFFGHFEIYAPTFTISLLFFYLVLRFLNKPKITSFLYVFCCWLLGFKFHSTTILLTPSLLLAVAYYIIQTKNGKTRLFTVKIFFKYFLTSLIVIGVGVYLLKGSFYHVREFSSDNLLDVVFLPVVSLSPAPLDHYNLFSLVHFWDYFNLWFLWSFGGVFLFAFLLVQLKRYIKYSPQLLIIGLTFITYFLFFFVLNPLLSMPNDWDLFSLPAIPFLILVLLLIQQVQDVKVSKLLEGVMLSFAVVSCSVFVVNASRKPLSQRLLAQGKWEFKTYWLGSSTTILAGVNLYSDLPQEREAVLSSAINSLEANATLGNDIEFAELLHIYGLYNYRAHNYEKASVFFDKADWYSTYLCKNHYYQLLSHFMLNQFEESAAHGFEVVSCSYPNFKESHMVSINAALEAGKDKEALSYCENYLKKEPDPFVSKIKQTILSGKDARVLFASASKSEVDTIFEQRYGLPAIQVNPKMLVKVLDEKSFKKTLAITDSLMQASDLDSTGIAYKLFALGEYLFNVANDYETAKFYFEEVELYEPLLCKNQYQLLLTNFMIKDFVKASSYCEQIVQCEYPNLNRALKVSIHTCIEANQIPDAKRWCSKYLNNWPGDSFIQKVNNAIESGESQEQLRSYFKQK